MTWHTRLFERDPEKNIIRFHHYNPDTEEQVIETKQDVETIVENAKGRANLFDERTPWKGDIHLVARIPITIIFELMQQGIWDDEKAMKKWLNDPDNRAFRTRPGRV